MRIRYSYEQIESDHNTGYATEIIRLSRVMTLLDEHTEHRLIHTGQNWDYELNEVFLGVGGT